ncbi:MAG: DUF2079 domain-containing protein, partial [Elusimicrobiota bacterium]
MGKPKHRVDSFCWLALLPWLALAWEAAYSLIGLDHSLRAVHAHIVSVRWIGKSLPVLGMLLCAWPTARRRLWEHLESGGGAWKPGPWIACAGFFAYYSHFTLARYFGFSLAHPIDSADTAALVWGWLDGRGTYSIIRGVDILSIHFHLTHILYAPLAALVQKPWVLFLAQSALLASAGLCGFLMAKRATASDACGWIALMTFSAGIPMINIIRAGLIIQIGVASLFLWAVYFLEAGRRRAALAAWVAYLGCSEQAAVVSAGFGVYACIVASL